MTKEHQQQRAVLTWKQLPTGYWHVRGLGPCNWTQPPDWPVADMEYLRLHAHPEVSEVFIRVARDVAKQMGG